MSKSLKDSESLSTDQHDANVISPEINCSDEAGQKNDKAVDNSYNEPTKRVSENLETSSTRKLDKRHKSRKRKRNCPSSSPEIMKRSNKKRQKKSRSRREKRKRSPSSSSYLSSSSSSSSTESENEIVDKRFKIVSKGEELKWNLPLSVTDYPNLHFKNYIPDKDITILTENPVPSNLQEIPVLDDFVKTLLVITTDHQMEKFQEKILQVRGPLSRLWKGLEDVRNESSEAAEVLVDIFATLIEQTTLLLGQVSLLISYERRLNILKTLLKDPRKAKTLLKEKTALLQEDECHLFGKKFRSYIIGIERSKKSLWEFLRVIMRKILPFEKALYLTKIDRKVGGDTITRRNQVTRPKQTKMFDFKTTRV